MKLILQDWKKLLSHLPGGLGKKKTNQTKSKLKSQLPYSSEVLKPCRHLHISSKVLLPCKKVIGHYLKCPLSFSFWARQDVSAGMILHCWNFLWTGSELLIFPVLRLMGSSTNRFLQVCRIQDLFRNTISIYFFLCQNTFLRWTFGGKQKQEQQQKKMLKLS